MEPQQQYIQINEDQNAVGRANTKKALLKTIDDAVNKPINKCSANELWVRNTLLRD